MAIAIFLNRRIVSNTEWFEVSVPHWHLYMIGHPLWNQQDMGRTETHHHQYYDNQHLQNMGWKDIHLSRIKGFINYTGIWKFTNQHVLILPYTMNNIDSCMRQNVKLLSQVSYRVFQRDIRSEEYIIVYGLISSIHSTLIAEFWHACCLLSQTLNSNVNYFVR